ncbi:hypothetical protein ABVS_3004 [Acinetobacter lwoffii]|nr:hypothetical protein ABVS_3004 [Acinetobacter lwoffii]
MYVCGLVEKRQRKHGTMSMYNTGCRCPQCLSACRAYGRARYQKLKQVA